MNKVLSENLNKYQQYFFLLLGVAFISCVFFSDDWLGLLLILFNFFFVLWITAKTKKSYLVYLLIIFVAHQFVSIYFCYFDTLTNDAFRLTPEYLASIQPLLSFSLHGFDNYGLVLSFFYKLDPSLLVGNEISSAAFLCFCYVFIKLAEEIGLRRVGISLVCFALLPSVLLWTSIVMREAWELLFFAFSLYFSVIWLREKKTRFFILFLCFLVLGALLHYFFFAILLEAVALLLCWPIKLNFSFKNIFIVFLFLCVIFMCYFSPIGFNFLEKTLRDVIEVKNNLIVRDAGLNYIHESFSGSGYSFGFIILIKLFHYVFGPFLWEVTDSNTAFLMLLSWGRTILIYRSFLLCRYAVGHFAIAVRFLFVIYCISVFIWSTDVLNYGTAIRHLIITDWIVVLLGFQKIYRNIGVGLENQRR